MKKIKIFALVLCILSSLACFSCKNEKVDISGYYTADKWSVSFDVKIVKNPPAFGILLFGMRKYGNR